jgi:hypothetical protein
MNALRTLSVTGLSLGLAFCFRTSAATNDLVITSIVRQGDCTTLTWRSHPGEYYTVYRAMSLQAPVFWQVAEVNVPSGGTNTTWSEGDCSESLMAGAPPPPAMSAEERAAFLEKFKDYETPAWLYPPGHPKNPDKANPVKSPHRLELEKSGGLEAALALSSSSPAGGRFYRVARTGVAGFIDGWGFSLGDTPENLAAYGDAFAVSASPRDLGAHSLAILTNGLVTAWGHASQGQCNVPTNLVDVVAVAAGGRHSMALTRTGELVMWGDEFGRHRGGHLAQHGVARGWHGVRVGGFVQRDEFGSGGLEQRHGHRRRATHLSGAEGRWHSGGVGIRLRHVGK